MTRLGGAIKKPDPTQELGRRRTPRLICHQDTMNGSSHAGTQGDLVLDRTNAIGFVDQATELDTTSHRGVVNKVKLRGLLDL